jgi:hypothetical protein
MTSRNYYLWKVFANLLRSNPEYFRLTGEAHPSQDGRQYFSFQYRNGYSVVNFHVYGEIVGYRFSVHTIDILMHTMEKYLTAACFLKSTDSASECGSV